LRPLSGENLQALRKEQMKLDCLLHWTWSPSWMPYLGS